MMRSSQAIDAYQGWSDHDRGAQIQFWRRLQKPMANFTALDFLIEVDACAEVFKWRNGEDDTANAVEFFEEFPAEVAEREYLLTPVPCQTGRPGRH
jgi:hypothetical protein